MLKTGALIVLAVFLAAAASIPTPKPSQPPIPSAGENSQSVQSQPIPQQQPSGSDQRGTASEPFIVNINPAPDQETKEAADRKEREREAAINGRLTLYTGLLALFTFCLVGVTAVQVVLFFWQLRLIKSGTDDARIAAETAQQQIALARAEFTATHRPRLIVRNVRNPDAALGKPLDIRFEVINIGGADAILTASKIGVYLVHSGASFHTLPLPMVGENPVSQDLGKARIGPGAVLRGTCSDGSWTNERLVMYGTPNEGFFFGAKILYEDPTGKLHGRLGVFRRFERPSMRFRSVNDPEFEYND